MQLTALGIYGPYPKAGGHAASGYLLETDKAKIVFDFGSGTLTRLLGKIGDIRKLDAIVVSHSHFDHTSDLVSLNYLMELLPDKILKLYVPKNGENWYLPLLIKGKFEIVEVEENDTERVGDVTLEFKKMLHTVPTLGVRVSSGGKSLFYTADTMWFKEIEDYVRGVDFVLADAAKPVGFKGPHMSIDKAELLLKACGTRVAVTHLSPDYDPTEALSGTAIEVIEEGRTYTV